MQCPIIPLHSYFLKASLSSVSKNVSCFSNVRTKPAAPRGFPDDYGTGGGCAAGGKAAQQRPPRETCPARDMPADQALSVARACRRASHARRPRLVNRPRHVRRPKRFRPQGMFAAQGIIPARGGVQQKPPSVLRRSQPRARRSGIEARRRGASFSFPAVYSAKNPY